MAAAPDKRSQLILRVPRDQTPATITLDDGDHGHAMLFVAPGDSVARWIEETSPFVPVSYSTGVRLVARAALACVTVQAMHAPPPPAEDDLPVERQRVRVRLRAGRSVEGELRWIATVGRNRTLDCMNDPQTHIVVRDADQVSYIAKAQIASVEEL